MKKEIAKYDRFLDVFNRPLPSYFKKEEIRKIVKEVYKKAGIEDKRAHPHTFRHSFAVFHTLN